MTVKTDPGRTTSNECGGSVENAGMNQVLSMVRAARPPSDSGVALSSDAMLVELLALHDEMIVQLRTERRDRPDTDAFLQSLIEQHENAAAMLRSKFARSVTRG